jgi:hypothetical protein
LAARAGQGTAEEESESLVAPLAHEAEYWKTRAEALDDVVDEFKAEIDPFIDALRSRRLGGEGSRRTCSKVPVSPTPKPPFRAAALIFLASLALWVLLGLLSFATYS